MCLALLVAACGGANQSGGPGGSSTVSVVTTSTVFADLIRNVGGDRVLVTSLVPAGADVHTYQATPDDLRAAADAELMVMNGLGLDDWLEETFRAASADAPIVKLAEGLEGIELLPGEEPGEENPHLWMDVANANRYVTRIAEAL